MKKVYLLFDVRAGFDDDCSNYPVLLSGTAKECCDAANKNEYGIGCVVATIDEEILWRWFCTGKWVAE